MMISMKRILFVICTICVVTSCAPKLYDAHVDMPEDYVGRAPFAEGAVMADSCWWRLFGDERLDTLERTALANNRDLRVAASRVVEAYLSLRNVKSSFLPQIGIQADASGSYNTPEGTTQEYTLQSSASWQVSLFGTWRHTRRAGEAEFLSSDWEAYGVELSLTAEVATAYFTLSGYARQLAIAERTYSLRNESMALIDSMYRYGFSSLIDLQRARSLVAQAEADIPKYREAVTGARYSLAVLLGLTPDDIDCIVACDSLSVDRLPVSVPVGLPSDLLRCRPDIRKAEYDMRAAEAKVGIARSARFPSLALTGAGGLFGSSVKSFSDLDNWTWSAAGRLTAPLFAFGKLRRNQRIACEQYMQAAYTYENTIFQALCDVETALDAIEESDRQIECYAQMVEANGIASSLTRELYKAGMSAYLDVIDAERELYASQLGYIELVVGQYVNYVDLVKSLGVGWRAEK